MIAGLNIRCNIGPFEVLRSPRIELCFRRRDVVSTCQIDVPDEWGDVRPLLAKKQKAVIRFGHRGESSLWQEWEGEVKDFTQVTADLMRVTCVGREQALIDTKITEAMHGEPADVVGRRLLERTGLPVADVAIPAETFPHMVFSGCTAARAIKQLSQSLERSFGHDLSKHAVWLGEAGLYWSAENEPGPVYVVESASNLMTNSPNPNGMSRLVSTLLPGLTASRLVHIHDARHGMDEIARAEEVTHLLSDTEGNTTTVGYGINQGWG